MFSVQNGSPNLTRCMENKMLYLYRHLPTYAFLGVSLQIYIANSIIYTESHTEWLSLEGSSRNDQSFQSFQIPAQSRISYSLQLCLLALEYL